MKTLDEYALEFEASGRTEKDIEKIANAIFLEIRGRGINGRSDESLFPALHDVEAKWQAFVKKFPECGQDRVQDIVKSQFPLETYHRWQDWRTSKMGARRLVN